MQAAFDFAPPRPREPTLREKAEVWRQVPRWPSYWISSRGRVRSHARRVPRIMNPSTNPTGYLYVTVRHQGVQKQRFVHRLVLNAFVGPCPHGMQACHGDGDRTNNMLENLRWASAKTNAADRERHGHTKRGSCHGNAKLDEAKVRHIRQLYAAGESAEELAERFNVRPLAVRRAVKRITWKHVDGGSALRQHLGQQHHSAKLTIVDVIEMRQRHANGESTGVLAAKYPVSQKTIWAICARKSWKHVR